MRIVIFNGSPRKRGNTAALLKELANHYKSHGGEINYYDLVDMDFKDCVGCMTCKREERCCLKDDMTPIYDEIKAADVIVIGSPIYMGAETATTKALIDRMYALLAPRKGPGSFSSRLASGKKAVILFTCGDPKGDEDYSGVVTRYKNVLGMFGTDAKAMIIPRVRRGTNVARSPKGQRALKGIMRHISS